MTHYFENKEIFYVNSRNRSSGTDGHFSIKLDINPQIDFTHAVLLSASIPNSFYACQNGYNTFQLEESGDYTTITVPPGNYTRNSFKLTCQELLNDNSFHGWTYAIEYQNIGRTVDDGKYTYNVSGNSGIQPSIITGGDFFEMLGFDANTVNTFVGSSIRSRNVVNVNQETSIYIKSDLLQTRDGVLASITSSSSNSFDYIQYNNNNLHETSQKIVMAKGNSVMFSITDEDGRILNLNGLNVNFSFMIFHHEDKLIDLLKQAIIYFAGVREETRTIREPEREPETEPEREPVP